MDQTNKNKISPGFTARNFRKISPNGFGDLHNAYPHSMTWFHDHLFVGTTRDNLAMRGVGQDPQWIGEAWPVKLPENIWDLDLRAQIWRYNPITFEWAKTYTSPMIKGMDGFDVPQSAGFRVITPFQGISDSDYALYVPTWATHQRPMTEILRSEDGINFGVVSEPGLGLPDPKPRVLRGLIPFKDRLFTSPAMGQTRRQPNTAGIMLVLVSDDPARGKWELACEPQFGDPNNLSVFHMAAFNDYLYAGTMNIIEGYQVWKTDAEGDPPFKWKKVVSNGAFRGNLNQVAMTLTAFGDYLYVGSAIQHGGYDVDNKIGPAPPEIIRIDSDDQWELVVGEPRITPEGLKIPLSGMGPGFENIFAGYIWSMCVHQGWLYVGNAVWSTFMKFSRRERWPEWRQKTFNRKNVDHILRKFGGCDIWRSRDGVRWIPVTYNGFNNCYNLGVRNMVSTPYGLFVGLANSFGPEAAVRRTAGWNYELNPKSGLEIWLGSHEPAVVEGLVLKEETDSISISSQPLTIETLQKKEKLNSKTDSRLSGGNGRFNLGDWREEMIGLKSDSEEMIEEMFRLIPQKQGGIVDIGFGMTAAQYLPEYFVTEFSGDIKVGDEDNLLQQMTNQFYHDSDFRHFGFWHEDINDVKAACENLMEEILAFVPNKYGKIVDVCCGLGATTRYLLNYFNSESITGITTNKKYLSDCRKNVPKAKFLHMKLPKIELPDSSFDFVIWCKGFWPLGSRQKLLKETLRILKPNGQLVCFDVLYDKGGKYQKKRFFWEQEDSLEDLEAYQNLLLKTGFQNVQLADITHQSIVNFRKYTSAYFELKEFTEDINKDRFKKHKTYQMMMEDSIRFCLLISAFKPGANSS